MKKIYLLFALLLLIASALGQKAKVILDADTGNEIDDMPTIVLALKSGKIDVLALTAAQWNLLSFLPKLNLSTISP